MNTFLFTLLCIVVAWIVFDAIYSRIVCPYFHTKLKYRLFALRDRLRAVRIENPTLDERVFRMMELQINGCIGLVPKTSFHCLFFAIFSKSLLNISEEDQKSALEMKKSLKWVVENRETEIGKQLLDIEGQSFSVFYDSFAYNSPFVTLFFRASRPVVRCLPKIMEWYKKVIEGDLMEKTVPAMMVNAAR
jgi:hypothetical protein